MSDLAEKLSNPVASLISVPFQNNFDFGGGPNNKGFRYTLNFQPVIPISLSTNWNLISRTILPFISQNDMVGTSSQTGLGDITQSLFFSPKQSTDGGWIWGVGPAMLIPTATDDALGTGKFGIGPTAVLLKQQHGWTYGVLANHIWSVAGDSDRDNVNSTFLQPFLSYTTKTQTTFVLNTESSYDWEHSQWTVPINVAVAQLVKIGKSPVQFQLGAKYYAEGPSGAPEWGLRFSVTLLFPK
ncbi:MAG TPA: transporter [Verrucomicrobiae bacterium]